MLLGFTNPDNDTNDFHQRVADQNIQSLEDRQEEIRHAKTVLLECWQVLLLAES